MLEQRHYKHLFYPIIILNLFFYIYFYTKFIFIILAILP